MKTMENPLIGIAKDVKGWYERFEQAARRQNLNFEIFDIARSDWMQQVRRYACIVWRPSIEHPWLEQAKEKIYFMESELGLRVFPNWKTFSLYDNKKAQAYFL